MKLLAVKAKNFRNIEEEYFVFSPDVTSIVGKNSTGKSNHIETFMQTMKLTKNQKELLRKGFEKGESTVELGDVNGVKMTVTMKLEKDKTRKLYIKTGQGVPVEKSRDGKTKSDILDLVWQAVRIDVEELESKSENDLLKFILENSGIDREYQELEAAYKQAYSDRTTAGQIMKTAKGEVPGVIPQHVIAVNVEKLKGTLKSLSETKTDFDNAVVSYTEAENRVAELEAQLKGAKEVLSKWEHILNSIDDPTEDYEKVLADFTNASNINVEAAAYESYIVAKEKAERAVEKWQRLEDEVNSFPSKRAKLLKRSGLALEVDQDNTIRANGVAIKELAENEKLTLLATLKMSQMKDGKVELPDGTVVDSVKCLVIENGSQLDREHRENLYKLAKEKGAQVVIERVLNERWEKGQWVPDVESANAETGKTIILTEGE